MVPLGSAHCGTVIVSLAPPEVSETVVAAAHDAVTEVGVPNEDAGTLTLVGGGALVGPVGGAESGTLARVSVAEIAPSNEVV